MRKLKLLENDLDTSEDKAADANSKVKESEAQNEELTRENKQLYHRISVLEGMLCIMCVYVCMWQCMCMKIKR